MARAIWTGAISFGLVNVPVSLYTATQSKRISFNQLERKSGQRVRYKRVAEESGKEVDWDDIVKGYQFEKGRFVEITPEELSELEPRKSRSIDIEEFVSLDEIDPITWNKTYYLGPQSDVGAERPYELLRQAMEETGRVGIGRFVMRTKEYLATVRPIGKLLALETMYFADEIRGADEVENAPAKVKLNPKQLDMAKQLIDSLTGKWDPEKYRDTYRERVMELIEKKAKGEEIVTTQEAEEEPRVVNLMKALEESLATMGKGGKGKKSAAGGGDLEDLTKGELYDRAAKADISGRSKMSKPQLVRALRKAS